MCEKTRLVSIRNNRYTFKPIFDAVFHIIGTLEIFLRGSRWRGIVCLERIGFDADFVLFRDVCCYLCSRG